jgi:hypothetical protein
LGSTTGAALTWEEVRALATPSLKPVRRCVTPTMPGG